MTDDTAEEKSLVVKKVVFLKYKLDKEIGYNYWKKYVASAFWSQVSTPINLTITMLTAITTAQIQEANLVSQSISSQLAIVSLIIATLNTFFRPHTQYATNKEFLSKWTNLGIQFEDEYYDRVESKEVGAFRKKLAAFQKLQDDVNDLRKEEGTSTLNFMTDFLFLVCMATCLRRKKRWLDRDAKIQERVDEKLKKNKQKKGEPKGEAKAQQKPEPSDTTVLVNDVVGS